MNELELCGRCIEAGQCQAGVNGVVTCVRRTPENLAAVRRLAEMGIRRGASIVLGQKTPGGGRIVSVAGSQLAVDAQTLRLLHVAA